MPRSAACPQANFLYIAENYWEAYMAKITFISHDGKEQVLDADKGMTVMEVAIKNSVEGIDADCGGACACATCHVYLQGDWAEKLKQREEMESDMLDFAHEVEENSRLCCQIKVSDEIDGLVVKVPASQF